MKDKIIGFGVLAFLFVGVPLYAATVSKTDTTSSSSAVTESPNEQPAPSYDEELSATPPDTSYSEPDYDTAATDFDAVAAEDQCNRNYDPCVEDSSYDLDCSDIRRMVRVTGYDEYRLDRDGDGYGCESYN